MGILCSICATFFRNINLVKKQIYLFLSVFVDTVSPEVMHMCIFYFFHEMVEEKSAFTAVTIFVAIKSVKCLSPEEHTLNTKSSDLTP